MPIIAAGHFDWPLFFQRIFQPDSAFWGALATTVYIAILSQVCGVIIGLFLALGSISRRVVPRTIAAVYLVLFRGTPLVVQIFFIYYGTNLLVGFDLFPRSLSILGVSIRDAILAGITALSLNEGAYMSEIIRAGISAIDKGQMEAAKSVGMPPGLAMRRIILPQAARIVVPPLGNEFNGMIKNTTLLAFIGVYELFEDADIAYSNNFQPAEVFAAVACWYLVLTIIWSLIQAWIERRLGASDREAREGWLTRLLGARATGDALGRAR